MPSGIASVKSLARNLYTKGSIMKSSFAALILALATGGAAVPAFARDGLPQAVQQVMNLKDGSTLYVFKDGKMAKESRFGRAEYLKQGEVLELVDGSKVTAVGRSLATSIAKLGPDRTANG